MSVFKPASPYRSMLLSVTHYSNASVNVNGFLPIRIPIGAGHLQFLYRSEHLPPRNLFRLGDRSAGPRVAAFEGVVPHDPPAIARPVVESLDGHHPVGEPHHGHGAPPR